MEETKFSKFSKYVLLAGVVSVLYVLITTILHTSLGSKVANPPPASKFMGPDAKN